MLLNGLAGSSQQDKYSPCARQPLRSCWPPNFSFCSSHPLQVPQPCTSPMPAFTVLGFLQILTHAPALAQVTSWVQPMPLPLGASYVPGTAVGFPKASQAWVKWSHYPPHSADGNLRLWDNGAGALALAPRDSKGHKWVLNPGQPDPDIAVPSSDSTRVGAGFQHRPAAPRSSGSITHVWVPGYSP